MPRSKILFGPWRGITDRERKLAGRNRDIRAELDALHEQRLEGLGRLRELVERLNRRGRR